LPVSRPAVSQHLKVLKGAGLVIDEAVGTRRLYRAAPGGVMALRTWLNGFWDEVFADYEAEMQRQMDERRST
jgi:DNA-binding transcriptional ArsR family regulator